MQALKILKHHSRYNPGEIAGFAPDEAARLIAAGIAEAYDPNAVPALEPAQPGLPLGGETAARDLDALTKAELIAHAKTEFDLDLDDKLLKAEMIAAIEAAAAKKV